MRTRKGHTLVELVVVLSVLAALAGMLVPLFTGTIQNAQQVTTEHSLVSVRDAVREYWRDTKHVTLNGITSVAIETNRLDISWLFANPVTGDATEDFSPNTLMGWRGPYLVSSTGGNVPVLSPSLIDAWNNQIAIQDVDPSASLRDVRIVSGGPDGSVNIPPSTATSDLTSTDIGDDVYVTLALH